MDAKTGPVLTNINIGAYNGTTNINFEIQKKVDIKCPGMPIISIL